MKAGKGMPGIVRFLVGEVFFFPHKRCFSFHLIELVTVLASQSEFLHFSCKNRGGRDVKNIILLKGKIRTNCERNVF